MYRLQVYSLLPLLLEKKKKKSQEKKKKISFLLHHKRREKWGELRGGGANPKRGERKLCINIHSCRTCTCQVEIETVMRAAFICHLPPGMLI